MQVIDLCAIRPNVVLFPFLSPFISLPVCQLCGQTACVAVVTSLAQCTNVIEP